MKYFQHDTNSMANRKLRKVIRTHGPTGYAIWWATLEELYQAESTGFIIEADELWLENLAESLCISDHRTLIRVFDTFAKANLISSQLWADHQIHVEAIVERGDEYTRKKSLNAQRQSKFREKSKAQEVAEKCVSNALRNAKSNDVTPQRHRQSSDPDPKANTKKENQEIYIPESSDLDFSTEPEIVEAEIIDSATTKGQSQSDFVESQIVQITSSAAPLTKDAFLAAFYDTYNERKPALWSKISKTSQDRERGIKRALQACNGNKAETLKMLGDALEYCRQDAWWGSKSLGIDNLLSKNHLVANAERWEILQSVPGAARALDVLADPKTAERERALARGMERVREIEARRNAEMAAANGENF